MYLAAITNVSKPFLFTTVSLTIPTEERYSPYSMLVSSTYPFYAVSNNLISLWFGSHKVKDDVIITNGDNPFKKL
jgi:hypothetical protein